jgi:glucose/arabinose dehydrogenase
MGRAVTRSSWIVWSLLIVATVAAACGDGGDGASEEPQATVTAEKPLPEPTATPPAPTVAPTPVAGGYELVEALPSAAFERMVEFAAIPAAADEAVIVTQGGEIWRLSLSDSFSPTEFGDLSDRVIDYREENEGGLLGLAFSPDLPSDGRVYVYYTAGEPRRSVLSRFQVVGGAIDPGSEAVLLEVPQPFGNHNGGQIAFGPDGYLYVALGDGGSADDPEGNGQDLSTLLASILRLDVSGEGYAVPPDNPFVDTPGARPEIYAYGLRNPWRFSFDRATGDLWAGDVGQDRWEEVDRIVAGANYGWNVMEGFECFEPSDCDARGLEPPRAAYGREDGCSVTGGYVYRGASMPELNGWYVYGDFCSGKVWAANTADDSAPVLLADSGLSIASFGELPDGELLALTFENAVFRLQRSQ